MNPVQTLNTDQVKGMRDRSEPLELINVLPGQAFREKHIPGSINIPVEDGDFVQQVEECLGGAKEKTVVVYCASTECPASEQAARRLEQAGFTNVFDYEAGVAGWEQAGLPIKSGA